MITTTFYAPTVLARRVQDQVKRFDGRFLGNPIHHFGAKTHFCITFEDGCNYSKFSACIEIIQQKWF